MGKGLEGLKLDQTSEPELIGGDGMTERVRSSLNGKVVSCWLVSVGRSTSPSHSSLTPSSRSVAAAPSQNRLTSPSPSGAGTARNFRGRPRPRLTSLSAGPADAFAQLRSRVAHWKGPCLVTADELLVDIPVCEGLET